MAFFTDSLKFLVILLFQTPTELCPIFQQAHPSTAKEGAWAPESVPLFINFSAGWEALNKWRTLRSSRICVSM